MVWKKHIYRIDKRKGKLGLKIRKISNKFIAEVPNDWAKDVKYVMTYKAFSVDNIDRKKPPIGLEVNKINNIFIIDIPDFWCVDVEYVLIYKAYRLK